MSRRLLLPPAVRTAWPALLLGAAWATADAAPPAGSTPPPDGATAFHSECSECHIAFPPRLLAAGSWRALMQGLNKHFGVDASIDPAIARAIGSYLEQNAGYQRDGDTAAATPPLRITTGRWFLRQHGRFSPEELKRQSAAGLADCGACHARAAQGQFEDNNEHGHRGGHDHD